VTRKQAVAHAQVLAHADAPACGIKVLLDATL